MRVYVVTDLENFEIIGVYKSMLGATTAAIDVLENEPDSLLWTGYYEDCRNNYTDETAPTFREWIKDDVSEHFSIEPFEVED